MFVFAIWQCFKKYKRAQSDNVIEKAFKIHCVAVDSIRNGSLRKL